MIVSKLRYLRIAPRKVRLVADKVRGKKIEAARTILRFTVKRGTDPVLKVLNAAIADAKNNFSAIEDNLKIKEIRVDGGPINKRWRARSRGMAAPIAKRTSHITIILEEIDSNLKAKVTPVQKQPDLPKRVAKKDEKTATPPKPETTDRKPTKETKGIRRLFRRKSI